MTRAHWLALAVAACLLGAHALAVVAVARAVAPKHHHQENPKP